MSGIIFNISAWLSSLSLSDVITFLTALTTLVLGLNQLLKAAIRTTELVTKLVNKLLRLWRTGDQRRSWIISPVMQNEAEHRSGSAQEER